jgi:serine/threonine protein kinase
MENPLHQVTLEGQSDAPLQPGLRLFHQRYELVKILGAGGMGVIWLAKDLHLDGKLFALKFLPGVRAWSEADLALLRREVLASQELRDVHLVATYGFEHQPPYAAMVMEHVEGRTLKQLLEANERGCFEPQELRLWMLSIVAALKYLHGTADRIHRDLKPANVMVTRQGKLKVMDFGISESVKHSLSQHVSQAPSAGSSHTLSSASPQQLRGDPAAESDDIYSLGALMYELLTGRPPFFRGDADAVGYQIRNEPPAGIDQRRGELRRDGLIRCTMLPFPPAWQKLIFDCLAKDPEDRPTLDELDDFFHQPVIQAAQSPQVEKPVFEKSGSASAGGRSPLTGLREAAAASSRESTPAPEGGFLLKLWGTLMLLALSFIGYMWLAPDGRKPLPPPPPIPPPVFTVEDAKTVVSRYYAAASTSTWQQTRLRLWAPAVSYFDHGSLTPEAVSALEVQERKAGTHESYKITSMEGDRLPGNRFRVDIVFEFHLLRDGQPGAVETTHAGTLELGVHDRLLKIESIQAERKILYPEMEKPAVMAFLDRLVALGEKPLKPGGRRVDLDVVREFYCASLERYYDEDPRNITHEVILSQEEQALRNSSERHYEWDKKSPIEIVSGGYGTPEVTIRRVLLGIRVSLADAWRPKPPPKPYIQVTKIVSEEGKPKVKAIWIEKPL